MLILHSTRYLIQAYAAEEKDTRWSLCEPKASTGLSLACLKMMLLVRADRIWLLLMAGTRAAREGPEPPEEGAMGPARVRSSTRLCSSCSVMNIAHMVVGHRAELHGSEVKPCVPTPHPPCRP